jgi:hypothetical protein
MLGRTRPGSIDVVGAFAHVLELARVAAASRQTSPYIAAVGILAELYARAGDSASAFRTIAEAHSALSEATESDSAPLFELLLARLRDRIGDTIR